MSKDDREDKENVTGAAAFTKIARGLSDLFTVLSDFDKLPGAAGTRRTAR